MLAVADVDVVFGVAAAASLWVGSAADARSKYDAPPRPPARRPAALVARWSRASAPWPATATSHWSSGLAAAQSFTRGALTVFSVVVSIELLGTRRAGRRHPDDGRGRGRRGGLAGRVAARRHAPARGVVRPRGHPLGTAARARRRRAARGTAALRLLAFIGVGNALIDVAGFTLLGRMAPDEVLARVFGVLESLVAVSIGVGALDDVVRRGSPGRRADRAGRRWAWSARCWQPRRGGGCGAWTARWACTTPTSGCSSSVPMLAHAAAAVGRAAGPRPGARSRCLRGPTVFEQGDVGDRYYVDRVRARSTSSGDGRVVATLGAGEGFGEIALLRRSARTATVVARTDVRLRACARTASSPVVLGYTPSAREAATGVDRLLDRYAPGEPGEPARPSTGPSGWRRPAGSEERCPQRGLLLIADIGGYTELHEHAPDEPRARRGEHRTAARDG